MVTELVNGAKAIRGPLIAGYSTLFSLWVLWGDNAERSLEDDELYGRLSNLWEQMGTAGRFSLVSLLALLIGEFMWRSVSYWFFRRLFTFHYADYRLGLLVDSYGTGLHNASNSDRADAHAKIAEIAELRRQLGNVQERAGLFFFLVPPWVAIAIEGGSILLLLLVFLVMLIVVVEAVVTLLRAHLPLGFSWSWKKQQNEDVPSE